MNVSLVACLARPARHAASRNAFLPTRSVTRLQRSRPLLRSSPLVWTLGSSRSFSWNPFGRATSQTPAQTPVPETPPPPPPISKEPAEASVQTSTQIPGDSSSLPQADVIAPADVGITDMLSDAAVQLASHPAPMQYGDMAALGIVSWTPAGIFPWILETVQVSTGLPWWEVIVLTTIGVRLALTPLIIRTTRVQAIMAPLQKPLQELKDRSLKLRQEGDMFGARQAIQQQQALVKKSGVNPFVSMFTMVAQVAAQIGFFLGLRRMCNVPVEQLKDSGFGWITDLTEADPTYILPLANFLCANLQLSISRRDMLAVGSPNAGHIINCMRLFSVMGIYIFAYLPAGVNLHLVASIAFISGQTFVLRLPAVRRALKLPPLPPVPATKPPNLKDTFNSIKIWYKRRLDEAQVQEAERQRKIRMAQQKHPRL